MITFERIMEQIRQPQLQRFALLAQIPVRPGREAFRSGIILRPVATNLSVLDLDRRRLLGRPSRFKDPQRPINRLQSAPSQSVLEVLAPPLATARIQLRMDSPARRSAPTR